MFDDWVHSHAHVGTFHRKRSQEHYLRENQVFGDEIRPGLIEKRHRQSPSVWVAEWEPHWICADMRERCFEKGIEENMFQIGAPDIWDYTAVLPETSLWSSILDWQWFSFGTYVSGCIFRLKDEQMSYACSRCSSSMATSALDENQLRSSTGECLGHSPNIDSGQN